MGYEHDDQRHDGQNDVGKSFGKVFREGNVTGGREEIEHGAGKSYDEKGAGSEFGNRNADVRTHLNDAVHGAVAVQGRKDAEWYGDDGHQHDAEGGQDRGVLQTEQKQRQNGLIHGKRMAEITVQHSPYPLAVLFIERQIQPHLVLKRTKGVVRGEFPENDLSKVAGKNHGDGKNNDGNAKKRDKHETEAFQYVNRTHVLPFSAL